MTAPGEGEQRRAELAELQEEVLRALVASQLPDEVRAGAAQKSIEVDVEELPLPPLLQHGLAQSGITVPEVWVRAIVLETAVKYLQRDIDRLEAAVARANETSITEGRVIVIVLTVVGVVVTIAAAIAAILA